MNKDDQDGQDGMYYFSACCYKLKTFSIETTALYAFFGAPVLYC